MKAITCAVLALACIAGLVLADYGYGGYSYMPVYGGGYGSQGGFGNGGFLMLIGLIFLILIVFGGLNRTATTGSSVTIVNATG